MENHVLNIIKGRTSVRDYSDRPLEKDKLDQIIESARLAPSASNSQPWHFYVVQDKQKIEQLANKMPLGSQVVINSFMAEAPVVVVATAGPIDILHKVLSYVVNKKWYYLDIGIALEHMALTAWEVGIGSCWIGWFDEKKVRSLLAIPKDQEIIAMLTLGYPKDGFVPQEKHRKNTEDIIKFI